MGRRSHTVGHVAGALAHVPDLADVTRTDGHAGSGAAVRHRAHQLPPESTDQDVVSNALRFLSFSTTKMSPPCAVASPVHSRLESLHCVQVNVPVVAADCENSSHDGRDPDPPTRGGQLGHVLPAVHSGVKALYGTQG